MEKYFYDMIEKSHMVLRDHNDVEILLKLQGCLTNVGQDLGHILKRQKEKIHKILIETDILKKQIKEKSQELIIQNKQLDDLLLEAINKDGRLARLDYRNKMTESIAIQHEEMLNEQKEELKNNKRTMEALIKISTECVFDPEQETSFNTKIDTHHKSELRKNENEENKNESGWRKLNSHEENKDNESKDQTDEFYKEINANFRKQLDESTNIVSYLSETENNPIILMNDENSCIYKKNTDENEILESDKSGKKNPENTIESIGMKDINNMLSQNTSSMMNDTKLNEDLECKNEDEEQINLQRKEMNKILSESSITNKEVFNKREEEEMKKNDTMTMNDQILRESQIYKEKENRMNESKSGQDKEEEEIKRRQEEIEKRRKRSSSRRIEKQNENKSKRSISRNRRNSKNFAKKEVFGIVH